MIEFRLASKENPKPILINVSKILYVYPDGIGTWIGFSNVEGDGIAVIEDYQNVKRWLQQFARKGY